MLAAEHLGEERDSPVAQFFCSLIAGSVARPGEGLWSSLGERASEQGLDHAARPDGYGRYLHPDREITFCLELDRGTEPRARLREKVSAYRASLGAGPNRTRTSGLRRWRGRTTAA